MFQQMDVSAAGTQAGGLFALDCHPWAALLSADRHLPASLAQVRLTKSKFSYALVGAKLDKGFDSP